MRPGRGETDAAARLRAALWWHRGSRKSRSPRGNAPPPAAVAAANAAAEPATGGAAGAELQQGLQSQLSRSRSCGEAELQQEL
eukprot:12657759-Alexandrium_andersonii.AAC.1